MELKDAKGPTYGHSVGDDYQQHPRHWINRLSCPFMFFIIKKVIKMRGMKAHCINITIYWSISSNISSTLEEQPWFELENDILCA